MQLTVGWDCAAPELRDRATGAVSDLERAAAGGGIRFLPGDPDEAVARLLFFARCDRALLQMVRRPGPRRTIAIGLAAADEENATWRILQAGAAEVIWWHQAEKGGRGGGALPGLAARLAKWREIDGIVDGPLVRNNLVGSSAAWRRALRDCAEIARFSTAPTLITGETGTGKELMARLIHSLDQRPGKGNLVLLDCTTVVPELAGSEFFGHERGAFTGAAYAREGAFALADGGTLFVDEVGELPLPLQAQLLRAIQEKTYKPVGSNLWKKTNFRLVAATNRDLEAEQRAGGFRSDFFHRLASNRCHLPPLRERCEDIIALAGWFLREELGRDVEIDPVVERYLVEREYPGNVRQLRQLMARIAARYAGEGPVTAGVIPESERLPEHTQDPPWNDAGFEQAIRRAVLCGVHLKEIGRSAEELAEQAALEGEGGNLQRAARRLGVTDRALQMRRAARRREPAAAAAEEGPL